METENPSQNGSNGRVAAPSNEFEVQKERTAVAENQIYRIPIFLIRVFATQPRKKFKQQSLEDLAASIKVVGQIQAGKVRMLDKPQEGYEYELVDGERRYRACIIAGVGFFRAEIENIQNEAQQWEKSVIANSGREDHTPIETARIIKRFKEQFGYIDKEICERLGKTRSNVQLLYSLNKLIPEIQDLVEDGKMNTASALPFTKMTPAVQAHFYRKLIGEQEEAQRTLQTVKRLYGIAAERKLPTFGRLSSAFLRYGDDLKIFADMSDEELKSALSQADDLQARMELVENIEELIESASLLKTKIEKVLTEM